MAKSSAIKRINITLPRDVHRRGVRKAKAEKRSFSNLVAVLIAESTKEAA